MVDSKESKKPRLIEQLEFYDVQRTWINNQNINRDVFVKKVSIWTVHGLDDQGGHVFEYLENKIENDNNALVMSIDDYESYKRAVLKSIHCKLTDDAIARLSNACSCYRKRQRKFSGPVETKRYEFQLTTYDSYLINELAGYCSVNRSQIIRAIIKWAYYDISLERVSGDTENVKPTGSLAPFIDEILTKSHK